MNDNAEELAALEESLANGDKHALAELFAIYRERLLRIIHFRLDFRLKTRIDAEDVLQDSYMEALKRIKHFQGFSGSSFVWLALLVKQTLIDLQRFHFAAEKRDMGKEFLISDMATSMNLAYHLVAQVSSPSRTIMQMDILANVGNAIALMDSTDQEILALRHFEEFSNKEAAESLGIEQKAASIRYIRAVKRLKEIMQQFPILESGTGHG